MGTLGWTYEEARYADVNAIIAGMEDRIDLLCRIGLLRRPPGTRPRPAQKLTPQLFDSMFIRKSRKKKA